VTGGCEIVVLSNILLQQVDQAGQANVTWIPVESDTGSVLVAQKLDHG